MLKTFDTKDAVPESLRDSAVETKDGKWAAWDVTGLKANADSLLNEKKQVQQRIDEMTKALGGLTPEQITKIREDAKRAEEDADRRNGDFDKLLSKRLDEQKAQFEKQISELAPFRDKYIDREVEFAIRDAAAKAGVPAEDIPYVVDLHRGRRVRYDEKTGKPVVVDKDGDPTGLTVEKFYAETFKAEAPKFYGPQGGSGGGAGGSSGKAGAGGNGSAPTVTDDKGFLANIDKIAKGEVQVAAG